MADENTTNPADPNPPTGDTDIGATPPPTEKISPPSGLPETTAQPAADTEVQQTPISETTETAAEPVIQPTETTEGKKEEVVETPAGETPAGETPAGETPAGETPAGETPAGEAPAGEIPAGEVAKTETTETAPEIQPVSETATVQPEKVEETPAEEIVEEVSQPQPETQPKVAIAEEEIIRGAPSKPGDKVEIELPPSPSPTVESVSETPPSGAATESIPPKTEKNPQPKSGFKPDGVTPLDGEEKVFAAVGYVGILALLPLLARRDSEFAQHHGRQGLVVAIIFIVLWLFAKLGGTFSTLVFVLQFAAIVGGFALSYKGDWFRIPGIYDISLKIKLNPQQPRTSSNEAQNLGATETPPQNSEEKEVPPSPQN